MATVTKAALREIAKSAHIAKRTSEKASQHAEFLAKKSGSSAADFMAGCIENAQAEAAIFAAEFERANPVKVVKPRAAKTTKKMTFSQWHADADMPEQDEKGNWFDLETGLYFNN